MLMAVRVFLRQVQIAPKAHKDGSNEEVEGQRLREQRDAECRADERSCREVCTGPGRAEVAEGQHEENEAHAIAEETNDGSRRERADARQLSALAEGKGKVHRAGDGSFGYRDLDGIGSAQLTGQVAVKAPRQACAGYEQRSPALPAAFAGPRQEDCAGQYGERANE